MTESHRSITRREILKRGAIVGGGVLWVAPVVQTLGMRPAMAADVSGGQCNMTMEIVSCASSADSTATDVTFKTCALPGCGCNPLPSGHEVRLMVFTPGVGNSVFMDAVVGASSCWEATFTFTANSFPAEVYALCGVLDSSGEIGTVTAESVHITVASDLSGCPT